MNGSESLFVAEGFREDCMELLSQFEILDQSNFKTFCEIWNNMKFCFVFSGRASHSELIEFCEEALAIAKEFISYKQSFKIKIGGIYLLYSLYSTMPVSQPKIRMVSTEWDNVIKLQRQLNFNKEYDAIYILIQLIEKNAFVYCCTESERGLENYYLLKDFMRGNSKITQTERKENKWTKIFNDLYIQNQLYIAEKQKLSRFSEHLVPKVFDISDTQKLIAIMKNLDSQCSDSNITDTAIIHSSPSTSDDVDFLEIKLDSGDDSDTSEISDDEDPY